MIECEQVQPQRGAVASPGLLDHGRGAIRTLGRFSKSKPLGAVGGSIVVLLVLVAVFADQLTDIDPRDVFVESVHTAPGAEFWLGTDHIGRNLFSRMVYGARISLYVGLGSVVIGVTAGFVIGIVSTYVGGKLDMVVQRFVDALMSLPGLIIALAIIAVLGSSLNNVIIAIVIGMLAPVIRTVRSQVLSLKELDYILAARAVGATSKRIVFPAHSAQLLRHKPDPGILLPGIRHHHRSFIEFPWRGRSPRRTQLGWHLDPSNQGARQDGALGRYLPRFDHFYSGAWIQPAGRRPAGRV